MATQMPTELEFFHRFLTAQLKSGGTNLSPEKSVEAFRAYQRDLAQCREDVGPALQRSLGGESEPLDIEDIKARGRQRMQGKSITE